MPWHLGEGGGVQVGVTGELGADDHLHSGLSHVRVKASALTRWC